MDEIIQEDNLKATYAYLDNVTICGHDQSEHDANLERFVQSANSRNITYNPDKCVFSTRKLALLGSVIEEGTIKADPERLRPLRELPVPIDAKTLRRTLCLFFHYSKWIRSFSEKVRPLVTATFPLSEAAKSSFQELKSEIENSVVSAIDENLPFQVETDASEFAIAGVLNQRDRPVAFFSRTLHGSKLKQASVEK